jgi:hypothetical protein
VAVLVEADGVGAGEQVPVAGEFVDAEFEVECGADKHVLSR